MPAVLRDSKPVIAREHACILDLVSSVQRRADGLGLNFGGAGATVTVSDDGPGVREQDRKHLFEPFFTTKSSSTGLGLAVSQAIARACGGALDLGESAVGTGARFSLRLPSRARLVA